MRYATLKGFEAYAGAEADSLEERFEDSIATMLAECEERMVAYIVPNIPVNDAQKTAFCNAVFCQLVYENRGGNSQSDDLPNGVKSFRIGNFQMSLDSLPKGTLTRLTIAPAAYAYLFNAGLLYRGVCS